MDTEKLERLRDRLLVCPICMDEYKDPRVLPCHHSICLECLTQFVQLSTSTGRFFRCPQCRADIIVPNGGVGNFPINFIIMGLLEEIGAKSYTSSCELCDNNALAQFRCVDCDIDICRFCFGNHRLFTHTSTRENRIIRLDVSPLPHETFSSSRMCAKHGEPCNVYCTKCDQACCVTCICEKHKSHKTISIVQKMQHLEEELDTLNKDLKAEATAVSKRLQHIKEFDEMVSTRFLQTKLDIEDFTATLHSIIDDVMTSDLAKVLEAEQTYKNKVGKAMDQLVAYQARLDNVVYFCMETQYEDTNIDLMGSVRQYNKELNKEKRALADTVEYEQTNFKRGYHRVYSRLSCFLFGFGGVSSARHQARTTQTGEIEDIIKPSLASRFYALLLRFLTLLLLAACWMWRVDYGKFRVVPVIFITVLMSMTLVYLSYTYISGTGFMETMTTESEITNTWFWGSTDILAGLVFCAIMFFVFCRSVWKSYT